MVEIKYCPSTLAEGYNTYSPQAVKRLFDGKKVSPLRWGLPTCSGIRPVEHKPACNW